MDSAASTQTHDSVLQAMHRYYTEYRANVGRGEYPLSEQATIAVDIAREQVASLLSTTADHILFTSGATQGLNMVANWNKSVPQVIITELEHNANIVPWLAQGRTVHNNQLRVIPSSGSTINIDKAVEILEEAPAGSLLSITMVSNVSGVDVCTDRLIKMARSLGHQVCIDACQGMPYCLPAGIASGLFSTIIDADYLVFSAHKMYGPTGVGAVYVKHNLDKMRPQYFGGGAVANVTFDGVEYSTGVSKHEPGTPNIASIIGFGQIAEMYSYVGYEKILDLYLNKFKLSRQYFANIPGLTPVGRSDASTRLSVSMATFIPNNHHSSDISTLLSRTNLAVRTGRLCSHPYVDKISKGKGVVRLSWGLYNDEDDFRQAREILENTMKKLN